MIEPCKSTKRNANVIHDSDMAWILALFAHLEFVDVHVDFGTATFQLSVVLRKLAVVNVIKIEQLSNAALKPGSLTSPGALHSARRGRFFVAHSTFPVTLNNISHVPAGGRNDCMTMRDAV